MASHKKEEKVPKQEDAALTCSPTGVFHGKSNNREKVPKQEDAALTCSPTLLQEFFMASQITEKKSQSKRTRH